MSLNKRLKKEQINLIERESPFLPGYELKGDNYAKFTLLYKHMGNVKNNSGMAIFHFGFAVKSFEDEDKPRIGRAVAHKRLNSGQYKMNLVFNPLVEAFEIIDKNFPQYNKGYLIVPFIELNIYTYLLRLFADDKNELNIFRNTTLSRNSISTHIKFLLNYIVNINANFLTNETARLKQHVQEMQRLQASGQKMN